MSRGTDHYRIPHAVLEGLPLARLQELMARIKKQRRRGVAFGLNGNVVTLTRSEAKSLVQEYIEKKTAAGRLPA